MLLLPMCEMMRSFEQNSYGLPCVVYLLGLIAVMHLVLAAATSGDTLIIRHGRSRVRHSSEKSHIRWGLQAFDNLTLYDYDYETSNGTSAGSNETLFDLGFGGNQTLFGGSDTFGYLSSDMAFGANQSSGANNATTAEWRPSSTRAPSSASTKKRLGKKQIMESIRKNVEEGLEYLRTHAHLAHPTAVMPSERALLRLQNAQTEAGIGATRASLKSSSSAAPDHVFLSKLVDASHSMPLDRDGKLAILKIANSHCRCCLCVVHNRIIFCW